MSSMISRVSVGLLMYAIGLFFAMLAFPLALLMAIFQGIGNPLRIFVGTSHDEEPKVAREGYNHSYVKTKSGLKFHYVHAGDEDKPLMLCIHGFPECWYSWKHVLKRFSSDYHVVAYDMRGYGDSDKPKSISQYHLTYLVNDVQEIITALGYQQAVIVAHDWGGAVAWQVPLFFPEVVKKLIVLNAPNSPGMREFTRSYPSQFLRSWYMMFFQIPFLAEFVVGLNDFKVVNDSYQGRDQTLGLKNSSKFLTDEEVEVYKYSAMRHVRYGINYYRAMNPLYRGMSKLRRVTKQIVQPTLIIWGKDDSALDYRMVPYCEKHVANVRSVIIEGASHWVGLDAPEEVQKAMEDFLKED